MPLVTSVTPAVPSEDGRALRSIVQIAGTDGDELTTAANKVREVVEGADGLQADHLLGFAGADTSFPLFAFVFLVALGIDYNIFLMTRVREETLQIGTRPGVLRGLAVTGGVITSAGVVLAATFSVLGVLPLVFLAELGFAVAFGVLLDTILVRSLLVPALVYDFGKVVWWPSRLAREDEPDEDHLDAALVTASTATQ